MRLLFIVVIIVCVAGQIQFDDANMVAFSHSGGGWLAFLSQWLVHWFRFQHQKAGTSFADYVNNKVIGSNSGGSWFSQYLTHSEMLRDSLSLDRDAFIDKVAQMFSTQGEKLKLYYEGLQGNPEVPEWLKSLCFIINKWNKLSSLRMFCSDEGMEGIYALIAMESWERYLELSFVELNEAGNEVEFDKLRPLKELKNVDWMATNVFFLKSSYKEEEPRGVFNKNTIKHTGYTMERGTESEYDYYPAFTSFKFDGSNMPERQVEIPLLKNKMNVKYESWEISCKPMVNWKTGFSEYIINDLVGKCDRPKWLDHNIVVEVDEIKKAIISATEKPHTYSAASSAALGVFASSKELKGFKWMLGNDYSRYDIASAIGYYAATMKVEEQDLTENVTDGDLGKKMPQWKRDLFNNLAYAMRQYAIIAELPNDLGFTVADGGLYENTGLVASVLKLQQNNVTDGEIVFIDWLMGESATYKLWEGHEEGWKGIFKGTMDKSRVATYPGEKVKVTYDEQCVETIENVDAGVKAGSRYKIKSFAIGYYNPELAMVIISGTVDKHYVPAMKEALEILETIPYDKASNTCSWESSCTV